MLPARKGQSPEERAREIEATLDWMRNNDISPAANDALDKLDKVGPVSMASRSPEQRVSDLAEALNWVRNKGKDDDVNDPTGQFRKLDSMLPKKRGQSAEDRAREIEGAMDWMRSKALDSGSDEVDQAFKPVVHGAGPARSPEQRADDMASVLNWMRRGKGKGKKKEDKYDPDGEFRKLDNLLPKKMGQTPEERARQIESALDWLRSKGTDAAMDDPVAPIDNLGFLPICRQSPEQRAKDLDNALNWMHNGKKEGKYDPAAEFRKLDSLLPQKRGQTPADRARDIEGALDWMRNSGLSPNDEDSLPSSVKAGFVPISRRTPEQRAKDLEDTLGWVRNKEKDI
jgi:hypothetical protein